MVKRPNYKSKIAEDISAIGSFLNNVKRPIFVLAFIVIIGIFILAYVLGSKYMDLLIKQTQEFQQTQLKLSREEINSTYGVTNAIKEQNAMMTHQNKLIEEHNKRHK